MLKGERFAGSFQKSAPIAPKVVRAKKRIASKTIEDANKAAVRFRDKFCRFPLCGCRKFKLTMAVAHRRHKGAGGNPEGDRSKPDGLIYLCSARHRENRISLDRYTLRIKPLTRHGYSGPCAWSVDVRAMGCAAIMAFRPQWIEVGREVAVGVFVAFTPEQSALLHRLRTMEL